MAGTADWSPATPRAPLWRPGRPPATEHGPQWGDGGTQAKAAVSVEPDGGPVSTPGQNSARGILARFSVEPPAGHERTLQQPFLSLALEATRKCPPSGAQGQGSGNRAQSRTDGHLPSAGHRSPGTRARASLPAPITPVYPHSPPHPVLRAFKESREDHGPSHLPSPWKKQNCVSSVGQEGSGRRAHRDREAGTAAALPGSQLCKGTTGPFALSSGCHWPPCADGHPQT